MKTFPDVDRRTLKRWMGRVWRKMDICKPESRRVALVYHSVGGSSGAVPIEVFRKQVEWLATNAERIRLHELFEGGNTAPLQVCITFDDGYASVIENAFPILQRCGFEGVVYVNPAWIGDASRRVSYSSRGFYAHEEFMTWADLKLLQSEGWVVGSHGVDHLDLTRLSIEDTYRELRNSRAAIEDRLDVPCKDFAYTWGRYNSVVRQAVSESGYVTGAAGYHGSIKIRTNRLSFPRIDIRRGYSLEDFIAVTQGDWDYLALKQRRWFSER